jgi:NADP-dependent 3-hydroxy acid dehydrogenase YdfG
VSEALPGSGRVAVVTGASSGIGEATARQLSRLGFSVVIGARREQRLRELGGAIGARWQRLDVTDQDSVTGFAASLDECAVLVNNAGGAFGYNRVEDAVDDEWQRMYDTNVVGMMRMTRALLPLLERSGDARAGGDRVQRGPPR